MTTTLTERYITATVSSLPTAAQDDVRAELTASIDDAVEARIEQGEDAEAAERAVLTDLGDPGILAAGFADRPLQLIGPKYYLTWWRLLKLLLIIVPICTFGGVALAQSIAGAGIGELIGTAIGATIGAIVHVGFWVTLVFAILERTGASTGVDWSLDQLPEVPTRRARRTELVAILVTSGLLIGAVLWDQFVGFARVDGAPVPVLNPALWPLSLVAISVLLAAQVVIAIGIAARGRWTTGAAIASTVVAVIIMSLGLTLLGRDLLVNPEFVSAVLTANAVEADTLRILAIITGFGFVAFPSWAIADAWINLAKEARR